jgi:hypothetical protein
LYALHARPVESKIGTKEDFPNLTPHPCWRSSSIGAANSKPGHYCSGGPFLSKTDEASGSRDT